MRSSLECIPSELGFFGDLQSPDYDLATSTTTVAGSTSIVKQKPVVKLVRNPAHQPYR